MTTKKRQPKTNGTKTRVVHVAIRMPTFNRIRKLAVSQDRTINYKIGALIELGLEHELALAGRG